MKLKDLPGNTNVLKLKLKLPKIALQEFKEYLGGETEMYIVGPMMGDFFLSPMPPDIKGERRLYSLPISIETSELLEWEVIS